MSKLAGYMAFTLFIHAATVDSNPEQRARLLSEVRPMLKQLRDDEITIEPIMQKVMDIMGDQWRMNKASREAIDALLNGDKK